MNQDYLDIVAVIQLYAEGWQNNVAKFEQAFEKDAWIFFTTDLGELRKFKLADCFEGWAATNWAIEPEILSFTQNGNLASVMLKFANKSNPNATFIDNLSLLKIGSDWKITNKTAIHQSTATKLTQLKDVQ